MKSEMKTDANRRALLLEFGQFVSKILVLLHNRRTKVQNTIAIMMALFKFLKKLKTEIF